MFPMLVQFRLSPDIISYGAMMSACERAAQHLDQVLSVTCFLGGSRMLVSTCGKTHWKTSNLGEPKFEPYHHVHTHALPVYICV